MNKVEVRDLSFYYRAGDSMILEKISLDIPNNSIFSLVGPNGSGKTTLLKVLSGFFTQNHKKSVYLDSRQIQDYSLAELAQKIAVVYAENHTEYHFSVYQIVAMGRIPYQTTIHLTRKDEEIVEEVLAKVNLQHLAKSSIHELSSGEKQRVWLAMALAQEPEILILDEITSHLDIYYQKKILTLIQSLAADVTIVMSIHDLNLARIYSDQVALIDHGKIIEYGAPEKVFTSQNLNKVFKECVQVISDERNNFWIVPKIE